MGLTLDMGNDAIVPISADLLAWYDRNHRTMPWRVGPGERASGAHPDPYRVWLSEVMLQQTTVATVRDYFQRFVARWPTINDLAAARDDDVMAEWAGLGYYARARNLLRCARAVVDRHGGVFPAETDTLLALPGIGPYTAAAVAAIAFDRPATVVDGNVERVVARLFAVETPLPAARPELVALAARLTPGTRPGDHAQAMMDLGATICTPRAPSCANCPLAARCDARAANLAATLPRRLARSPKPVRMGSAYVLQRSDGALLLERRPEKGLLGGMLGFPTTDWTMHVPDPDPPLSADWRSAGDVHHVFTHFHLTLSVFVSQAPLGANPQRGQFIPRDSFDATALPTLMRKVHDVASRESPRIERQGAPR